MQKVETSQHELLICPQLPLAVYREVAAHLRQIAEIQVELIAQPAQQFNYSESQIGGLWLQFPNNLTPICRQQLEAILAYYVERYGPWQRHSNPQL